MKNTGKITPGKIFKKTVAALVYIFCALMVFRCCFAANHSTLSDIYPTDALRAAYAAQGDSLSLLSHDVASSISSDGYMTCYAFVYCPDASELQVTVRYNASVFTYNSLPEDTRLRYTLFDSGSGTEYDVVIAEEETHWMYTYQRLVVSGVSLTDENDLDIRMYADDRQISSDTVHYADQNVVLEPYKLSRSEKNALRESR